MKKIKNYRIKLFFLFFIFYLNVNTIKCQILGWGTQPPNDPSCYTNVLGCTNWSNWSNQWLSVVFPSGLSDQCSIYANYKIRYCIDDPSNVEIWVGAYGVYPFGSCPTTNNHFISNLTLWKMRSYRQAVYEEFRRESVRIRHRCNIDPPIYYSMRWPGTCTFKCIYQSGSSYAVSGDIPCYPNGFCCGKTYILCWNEELQRIEERNEITIAGGSNCNMPTGNPPTWLCPPEQNGLFYLNATSCEDDCQYANE